MGFLQNEHVSLKVLLLAKGEEGEKKTGHNVVSIGVNSNGDYRARTCQSRLMKLYRGKDNTRWPQSAKTAGKHLEIKGPQTNILVLFALLFWRRGA